MEEKTKGIVIGGVNYGENDRILSVFTPDKGVVTAMAKGVKKAGAKLKFFAEPFCFSEVLFSVSGDKRRVTGASLIESFYPLREDIVKFFCAGTVAEFAKKFCKEGIEDEKLFYLVLDALKDICYDKGSPKARLVKFLTDALETEGYGLNLGGCFECGEKINGRTFFDRADGAFYCEAHRPENAREINPSTLRTLLMCAGGDSEVTDGEAVYALRLLDNYVIGKTEENIRSLKELIK